MSDHTPTPWEVTGYKDEKCVFISPANCLVHEIARCCRWDDTSEAAEERNANAAFIVRACNAHDDLLAACASPPIIPSDIDTEGGLRAYFDAVQDWIKGPISSAIKKAKP